MTPDFILGDIQEDPTADERTDESDLPGEPATRVKEYDGLTVRLGEHETADTIGADSNGA